MDQEAKPPEEAPEQQPEEQAPQTPEPTPEAAPPEVTPEPKPKRQRAPKKAQTRPLTPASVGLVVDHNFWTSLMQTQRDMDRTQHIDRYDNFSIM